MNTIHEFGGSFLIWEPDPKSLDCHRLIDSDRPYTSYFRLGSVSTDGVNVFFRKSRNFVRLLAFAALTPVWGGLTIGLVFCLEWIAKGFVDQHVGATFLFVAAVSISGTVFAIVKAIKPILRRFPCSQIANVRVKHVQLTRNNVVTSQGLIGLDFSVVPPDSFAESSPKNGPFPIANRQKCSFVTFIAESEAAVRFLADAFPKAQVALAGTPDLNIPPQQVAPAASSAVAATPKTITAKRYRHEMPTWFPAVFAAIAAVTGFFIIGSAATNHQGLVVEGIHLGPTAATIFQYLFGGVLLAIFLLFAAVALRCLVNPHSLLVNRESIVFTRGWLKPKATLVPFHAVHSLAQQQSVKGGSRTLLLSVGKNRPFAIHEEYLGTQAYVEICAAIDSARKKTPEPVNRPVEKPPDDSRYMPKM